jgi:hypothetical protein
MQCQRVSQSVREAKQARLDDAEVSGRVREGQEVST